MKLFYKAGACSLSPHIILNETGLDFSAESVNLSSKKTETGADFLTINPKGQVPALQLNDRTILTEGVAIVQYLADQKPDKNLIAPAGDIHRYRTIEWLNFVATELHKGFSPLFNPKTPAEYLKIARERLHQHFRYLDTALTGNSYLLGDHFTVADAYLFTIMRWAKAPELDLKLYSNITKYMAHVAKRPAVSVTLAAEGLQ